MALIDIKINVSKSNSSNVTSTTRSSVSTNNSNISNSPYTNTTLQALNQAKQIENALKAMDFLLNDEADIGLKLISDNINEINHLSEKERRTHHTLGETMILSLANGVIHFLEATLGFEPSKISKAQEVFGKVEQLAIKAEKFNIANKIVTSEKYDIGLECKMAYIEACLLNAVLMLFTESYLDSIKALYKLKKAYSGLSNINKTIQNLKDKPYKLHKKDSDNIDNDLDLSREISRDSFETCFENASECHEYEKTENNKSNEDTLRENARKSLEEVKTDNDINCFIPSDVLTPVFEKLETKQQNSSLSQSDEQIIGLMKEVYLMRDARLRGSHLSNKQPIPRKHLGDPQIPQSSSSSSSVFDYLNSEGHTKPTVDEFIESGVLLCYGIIQLILSILPPAVTTVLNAIGFKINKLEGLQLLWDVVNERNIFSGLSLGGLVVYYHGPFKFIDNNFNIPIKDNKIEKLIHPGELLDNAILKATWVFPESSLWVLQEGIILSSQGRLKEALDVITRKSIDTIKMQQIKAEIVFCRAILYCFNFDFENAAKDFLYLLEINEWSHAFYTYYAGCCYLEAYRACDILENNEIDSILEPIYSFVDINKKQFYKQKAMECLEKAPTYLNKKKFMSNNLPFDNFMLRKLKHFKENQKRLKSLKVDLIDSVATSPLMELIYLYDGFNRMDETQLKFVMDYALKFENNATNLKIQSQENINIFLQATIFKNLKEFGKADTLIEKHLLPLIINPSSGKYIKLKDDPWLYPSIFYEYALINWNLKKMPGLKETIQYLKHSLNYMNDYELSSRIGMRSQAALNRCQNK